MTDLFFAAGSARRDQRFADWLNSQTDFASQSFTIDPSPQPYIFDLVVESGDTYARCAGPSTISAYLSDGEWKPVITPKREAAHLRLAIQQTQYELRRLEDALAALEVSDG